MPVVYLQHPVHGAMAYSNMMEVDIARANGWVEFDPTVVSEPPVAPVTPPAIPSFLTSEPKKVAKK